MMSPLLLLGIGVTRPLASLASFSVLSSVAYIALFASAIAFLLWSRGVSQLGPVRAGQFVHLMPIFGAGLAFAVLGEAPGREQIIGALLVLSGIALVEHRARQANQQSFPSGPPSVCRHSARRRST